MKAGINRGFLYWVVFTLIAICIVLILMLQVENTQAVLASTATASLTPTDLPDVVGTPKATVEIDYLPMQEDTYASPTPREGQ